MPVVCWLLFWLAVRLNGFEWGRDSTKRIVYMIAQLVNVLLAWMGSENIISIESMAWGSAIGSNFVMAYLVLSSRNISAS